MGAFKTGYSVIALGLHVVGFAADYWSSILCTAQRMHPNVALDTAENLEHWYARV